MDYTKKKVKYLNPVNLDAPSGVVYSPAASWKSMIDLNPREFKYWSMLRSDYCSFASQAQKKHKAGAVQFDNTLQCYSKTNITLAEMLGTNREATVSSTITSLCNKGYAARIPFQYDKSKNLGRNLIVLDKGLEDYQAFLLATKEILERKVELSRAKNGGNAGKYLRQLLPHLTGCDRGTDEEEEFDDGIPW